MRPGENIETEKYVPKAIWTAHCLHPDASVSAGRVTPAAIVVLSFIQP